MPKVSSCILPFICSFICYFCFPSGIGAQGILPATQNDSVQQEVSEIQEDSIQISELRLSEIIKQSNTDVKTLETFKKGIYDTLQYKELDLQYADYLQAHEAFKEDQLNRDLSALSNREITSLITVLRYQGKAIEASIEDYENAIDQLDQEGLLISKITMYWEGYSENKKKVPRFNNEILVARIDDILGASRGLSELYESRMEELLIKLNQLTNIHSEIDDEIKKDTGQVDTITRLFDKNRESFMQGAKNFSFANILSKVVLYGEMVSYDLKNVYTNLVGNHLLVLCIFLLFLILCLRTKKQLKTQELILNQEYIHRH